MQKILMVVSVIAVIALAVLNLAWENPKPDVVYEMANRHIEWTYAKENPRLE